MNKRSMMLMGLVLGAGTAQAAEQVVQMRLVTPAGVGQEIGTIRVTNTHYGALFTPQLHGLSAGIHGFHLHQKPACGPGTKDGKTVPGLAAGGHFDPRRTGHHEGPYRRGHLGDLPALYADAAGDVTTPVLAPRLKVKDLKGHSLVIHAGGDNYSDAPAALGGGGARVACGVVQ
ncbi:MAG: superoxide dismutase [Chromatiales bacterium 21-64-14]|nr:MAG: superoxide dismutase [Chromatiales bacterium 21-64-14]HQU16361.1 superoxide dismutase [Cu-Zn] SodC [Gammaproteobacteria bacterium]